MIFVKVSEKGGKRRVLQLEKPQISVGRAVNNDIVLPHERVSARHTLVARRNDALMVKDAGSESGTYVNGQRLEKACRVRPEDVIGIGNFMLQVAPDEQTLRAATVMTGDTKEDLEAWPLLENVTRGQTTYIPDVEEGAAPTPSPQPTLRRNPTQGSTPRQTSDAAAIAAFARGTPPAPAAQMPPGQMPPAQVAPAQMPPLQMAPTQMPPAQVAPAQMPPLQMAPTQMPPARAPVAQPPAAEPPPAEDAAAIQAVGRVLGEYVARDDSRHAKAFGTPCTCGECVTCQARTMVEDLRQ